MKLKRYNLTVGQYGPVPATVEAKLPDSLEWIYTPSINKGYSNYLSIMNLDEYNELSILYGNECYPFKCNFYNFLDKVIIIYDEILSQDGFTIVSEDRLLSKINLDDYCIIVFDNKYNIDNLYKITDITSNVGYANYKEITLHYWNEKYYSLCEGNTSLFKLIESPSLHEGMSVKLVKGDIAKKFWNSALRKVVDFYGADFNAPIDDTIKWSAGIANEDFNDLDIVINKLEKFNEQFK